MAVFTSGALASGASGASLPAASMALRATAPGQKRAEILPNVGPMGFAGGGEEQDRFRDLLDLWPVRMVGLRHGGAVVRRVHDGGRDGVHEDAVLRGFFGQSHRHRSDGRLARAISSRTRAGAAARTPPSDLVVVLDAPYEIAYARKPDLLPETWPVIYDNYLDLSDATDTPWFAACPTEESFDQTRDFVFGLIRSYLAHERPV